mmetsp:Transcript_32659/g.47928  ORF Transcript_32659/g.47928 Transcript_32659/m.47928 type:complete len:153 (-) Transcript_32659:523-981(-)
MQIALGADIRITTPTCKLSIMESKWGLIPDMSASITLRELVRIDVAKELTMTGRIISGREAANLGLVTHCVEDDEHAMKYAIELAKEICTRSPDAVAASKRLYQETWVESDEGKCLHIETDLQTGLMGTWNQVAVSMSNFGWKLPFWNKKKI